MISGSSYPVILWIHLTIQIEPRFIRKLRDVKHSWRIVKEALQPLAVAKLFLFILFQQLVNRGHCVVEAMLFSSSLTSRLRATRLMEQSSQRFSGIPLQPGIDPLPQRRPSAAEVSRVRPEKYQFSSTFSPRSISWTLSARCVHQIFPCIPSTSRGARR